MVVDSCAADNDEQRRYLVVQLRVEVVLLDAVVEVVHVVPLYAASGARLCRYEVCGAHQHRRREVHAARRH